MKKPALAMIIVAAALILAGCGDSPKLFGDRLCSVVTSGSLKQYPELMPPGVGEKMRMRMSEIGVSKLKEAGQAAQFSSFYSCNVIEAKTKACKDTAIGGLTPERKEQWKLDSLDLCATLRIKLADRTADQKGKIVAGQERETTILILRSKGHWYMDPSFLGAAF